jgi:hypothetical protein
MAIEYPDIIGEYAYSPLRNEVNNVQFFAQFERPRAARGELCPINVYYQSCLQEETIITVKIDLPSVGLFKKVPVAKIAQDSISVALEAGAAGVLHIPVSLLPDAKAKTADFGLEFNTQIKGPTTTRLRPNKLKSRLRNSPFDDFIGLKLTSTLGVDYSTRAEKKVKLPLAISAEEVTPGEEDLKPSVTNLWRLEDFTWHGKAVQEINQRRRNILEELKLEPIFANLYVEGKERFAEANISLKTGEAIALAKILTYTANYFLKTPGIQDGLLVPIWERALVHEFPTTRCLDVIRMAGFEHITRLAMALSFSWVASSIGRHLWSLEERRALNAHVIDCIEEGKDLPLDFLYLPLLMGGVMANGHIIIEEEDVEESLALIKQAYESRKGELFKGEDMLSAKQTFEQLLRTKEMKR